MHAAIDAHRKMIKEQKAGLDEFYHVGMMLLKLVNEFRLSFIAIPLLVMIMTLCIRDFSHRFLFLDLWASQIPAKPGLDIAGRGSVFLSFLPKDSLAGHYMIYPEHIDICFLRGLRRKNDTSFSSKFIKELEHSLDQVKTLAYTSS